MKYILVLSLAVQAALAQTITSITPSRAPAGWLVTIAGSNFGASQGTSTVKFNGVSASTTSWTATSITATVPAGATSGNVVVTVNSSSSNLFAFTVGAPPPSKEYIRMGDRVVAIENPPPPVANFSISSSSFRVSDTWTLWLSTNIPNTWFTICALRTPPHSCTPNFGQTDANGNWTLSGGFSPENVGSWQEWVVFPTATSNSIFFTVSP